MSLIVVAKGERGYAGRDGQYQSSVQVLAIDASIIDLESLVEADEFEENGV